MASRRQRRSQRLAKRLSGGATVTLLNRSAPADDPVTGVPAVFPRMSSFDRLGLEAGEQIVHFAKLALGAFVPDGSTRVEILGKQYSYRPLTAFADAPPGTTIGDSQSVVIGAIATGA